MSGREQEEQERGVRGAFSLDLFVLAFKVLHSFSGTPYPHVSSLIRPASYCLLLMPWLLFSMPFAHKSPLAWECPP